MILNRSYRIPPILSDFRLWVFIFFCIRLIGITNPPLEISHNWRQVTVNMVARNYYEGNTTFLYPMMDNAGEKSGITGTEFPILNELIALFAYLFGWQHWYGRLFNLFISSIGVWYFYRWIKEFIDDKAAFPAGIILFVSMWFSFARKSMPDTFSMAICFIGLYYGYCYLRKTGFKNLLYFFLFGTLGVLCKIPSIIALSPLFIEIIFNFKKIKSQLFPFLITGFIMMIIVGYWYFFWFQHLVEIGNWQFYMFGPGFPNGLFELFNDPYETLDNFFFESLKFTGFLAFLAGLYVIFNERNTYSISIFALFSGLFLLFMIQAGSGFSTHDYYTIPFVPIMAFIAGFSISRIPIRNLQIACLVIISAEGIANQHHDFWIHSNQTYKADLEILADSFSSKNDLIIINAGQNPQELYFTHRKGWSIDHDLAVNSHYLDSLTNLGAKYLIIDKHQGEGVPEGKSIIIDNADFSVVKLKK